MLQAVNITKHIGARTLFAELSVTVSPQMRMGFVGANGAGKSTLLRILAGEAAADEGTITLGKDEKVGFLPQEVPRSGSGTVLDRVLQARPDILEMWAQVQQAETALQTAQPAEATDLAGTLAVLNEQLALLGGHAHTAGAKEILHGLGFAADRFDTPLHALSGGWWMRVELARLLHAKPTYLLLDEPTNHLDLASLSWLENFLRGYQGGCMVVSHDRAFLNATAKQIAELSAAALRIFTGNFDDYIDQRAALKLQTEAQAATQRKQRAQDQAFIDRFGAKASKAKQAQSRRKKLEKQQPVHVEAIAARRLHIVLPPCPRAGKIVATLRGVHKRFDDKILFENADLTLPRGARVALLGHNGAGKSTLLKMLAGVLPADRGEVSLGHAVAPFYFAQHTLDTLQGEHTVMASLASVMPEGTQTQVRGILGAFLFPKVTWDKQVAQLSGGEKSRLALARMLSQPCNFLLLDEPTNHLDLDSRAVLEETLLRFEGTLVFVSHDRTFVNKLATQALHVQPGEPLFLRSVEEHAPTKVTLDDVPVGSLPGSSSKAEAYAARKAQARQTKRRATAQTELEAQIDQFEQEVRDLDAQMSDPAIFADAARCQDINIARQRAEQALLLTMERWEALAEEAGEQGA